MTPKEKAKELVDKFLHLDVEDDADYMNTIMAKQCAIICVDEILNGAMVWQFIEGATRTFWQQVKTEIEKL